jgi:very-short-patch-repair endonuclease
MRATQKYKSLPFNPALKNRAKALRKAGLLHEALLWLELKNKKLNTLDFDRQKIIGNYIVDFYCAEKGVVIEVDGCSHDHKQPEDALRDQYLNSLGLVVIRLLAKDVLQNRQGVVTLLRNHPALTGTTPQPRPPRPDGHPSVGGESPQPKPPRQAAPATPPEEGNDPATNSPPMGGNDRDGFPSCGGVPRRGGVLLEGRDGNMTIRN